MSDCVCTVFDLPRISTEQKSFHSSNDVFSHMPAKCSFGDNWSFGKSRRSKRSSPRRACSGPHALLYNWSIVLQDKLVHIYLSQYRLVKIEFLSPLQDLAPRSLVQPHYWSFRAQFKLLISTTYEIRSTLPQASIYTSLLEALSIAELPYVLTSTTFSQNTPP